MKICSLYTAYELGKAFDIAQKEVIKWIKLRFGIDLKRSEFDFGKIVPKESIKHIKKISYTEIHDLTRVCK